MIKSLRMSWHRLRRVCGGKPCAKEYQEKKEELERLKKLDEEREIDLYYLDESGFSVMSNVSSAWQNIGEYIGIKSSILIWFGNILIDYSHYIDKISRRAKN